MQEILRTHPLVDGAGGRVHAFHLGDVRSGNYGTFVESSTVRPDVLTTRDEALLKRYVHTSEYLIVACRYGARRDFDAALDIFSCGWSAFRASPYPKIFLHLADRYTDSRHDWNPHLTAHEGWHRMLRTYRIRVKPRVVIDTVTTLHDRFAYAGLETSAAVVLTPEFPVELGADTAPDLDRFEVALYGSPLSLEGMTVYEIMPQPLTDTLRVLGEVFTQRQPDGEIPFLSAAELSQRTNRTPAAIAQTVRRFRHACQKIFREAADHELIQDAVIQGRPGYRINPGKVQRFRDYSSVS
ncbi:hypothetical protein [Streptomyces sp. NPDC008137]|uniref:hypothetical protein n=1 Tax=Streptomyces sp. NPDC008137 TaxID=3364813 RepID=UPI0036EDB37C